MKRSLFCLFSILVILSIALTACNTAQGTPTATAVPNTPVPPTQPLPTQTNTPAPTPTPQLAGQGGLAQGTDGNPWWNDSTFYEIFVRSFYDSNGDGIGDLNGVIEKLDYLNDGNPATTTDLGVTGIWLMPVFPSPSYHGYDVTDYYNANPQYGTLDDMKRLISEAHKRGIRVIIDMVFNHTSSQHPWFKAAQDPKSPYRNWYIWSDTDPGYKGPWGEQVWYPTPTGYYYGIFTGDMPDLNFRNPDVTKEMDKVTSFWLKDVGVDGFRLDAAKHLIEDGMTQENTPETHDWFKQYRPYYKAINPNAMTVGEVQGTTYASEAYVQGDQLDLVFDFDLASTFIKSVNSSRANSVISQYKQDISLFKPNQFAAFLTNHDQNRAMNQLLASPDRARLGAALLLTSPGVPFIYYGEEIGMMGAKPDEKIRTPMQWSGDANAGFTTGTPWEAVNDDYTKVNVAAQTGDKASLLSFYRAMIRVRSSNSALRVGDFNSVQCDQSAVFSSLRVSKDNAVLVVINLSKDPVTDYKLSLDKSALSGAYKLSMAYGEGQPAALTLNASGGFDSYQPLASLAGYGVYVISLVK